MEIIVLSIAFLNLVLASIIYFHSRRQSSEKFFTLIALSAGLWSLATFLMTSSLVSFETFKLGVYLHYIFGNLVFLFLFWFTSYYPQRSTSLVLPSIFTILNILIFVAMIYTPFLFQSFTTIPFQERRPSFNPGGYLFFSIFVISLFIISEFRLIKRYFSYKNAPQNETPVQHIMYLILGTAIASFLALFSNLILPGLGNFSLFRIGPTFATPFIVIIGYAIFKQQLFNIRVIATELLTFTIWIFLLVRFLTADTLRSRLVDGTLLTLVIFFGILLIRSVLQEVHAREEIQRLSEGLRNANRELKKLDRLKSEFLSLATHQLRTPLSIVKGYISMVQEGTFGDVSERVREALRRVYLSNERLINLVNDFLNISRIESGRMEYDFAPLHIEELIQSVVDEFLPTAIAKQLELIWERPQGTLPLVSIDREKFRQVLANLFDNAVKYTPSGSIKVEARRESRPEGGEDVLICIRDTGIGISAEELDSVFKRFSRGETGARVYKGGLGLGLYLAKRIVQDLGGEIWAESEGPGQGSAFLIRLPAAH